MRYGTANARERDDFITATLPSISSDDDGKQVRGTANVISFCGNIKDVKDSGSVPVFGEQRRNVRVIEIACDADDVADLTIDYTLTYEGSNDVFQVTDKVQVDFRFTALVVAKHIS